MKLRMLSASDIEQALSMADAIEVNSQAYAMLSAGKSNMPKRLSIETVHGTTLFMPAYLNSTGALAVKVVSIYQENSKKNLPTINAIVLVIDSETGIPLALLDGTRLTALRTGAGAGVATSLLAKEDAHLLAMFGAGVQAMSQIEAVLAVRPIEEVRIYTPSGISAQNLAGKLSQKYKDLSIYAVDNPDSAVKKADIISCATTSNTPVFNPAYVSPGTHINGIGSFKPETREVQIVGLNKLRIFVDCYEAALDEAGDLIQAIDEGYIQQDELTEIGELIIGESPGRASSDEITFFKSVGVAVQDTATSQAVLANAAKMNLGTEFCI